MLDFKFDEIPSTLQSQYSDSKSINSFVKMFSGMISPQIDIELFYHKIFNIYTAEGVGLDIWGRILGTGRFITIDDDNNNFFGFDESLLSPFDQNTFNYPLVTNTYRIEDEAYRKYLLLIKAYSNIAKSDAHSINRILKQLFPGKNVYILNVDTMKVRFVFEFYLTPFERALFNKGLMTRGAGVGYEFYELEREMSFGFLGSGLQAFDNGIFTELKKVI